MRDARRLGDGSLQVSEEVAGFAIHRSRYKRFMDGLTFEEIAQQDNVMVGTVKQSINQGRAIEEAAELIKIRALKHRSAIETEILRRDIRKETSALIVLGLRTLLEGKKTVPEINPVTGVVTMHEYVDPEVVAMGIEQTAKILSMQEKPAQSQTFVNIQNNQNNLGADGGPATSSAITYEERVRRIRTVQLETSGRGRVFEATSAPASEPESETIVEPSTDNNEPPAPLDPEYQF